MIKKINISLSVHTTIRDEAERLQLSHKDYVEAAVTFFSANRIDPRQYTPNQVQDVAMIVQKAVDRIFSYLVFQEKHLLQNVLEEVVKGRVLNEIAVNNALLLSEVGDEEFAQLQQQNDRYFAEKVAAALQSYQTKQ
ncbi:BfmA/BtgA family mobilization protein [Tunicatimonas pelagia]|uniref:BfmA/BtgA family mobilization protein n=1 Tax=Tunicatimonas pelagia TaxID=931531 RepID=UPI002664F475|nr:BfmA/BtgA family mobilization protein [Tunicatimonas pelagia]WKN44888.1 BfmA/BtgA family mobilization protein [Tunicatimonas pelagia]